MTRMGLAGSAARLALLAVCLCAAGPPAAARAQAGQDVKELKRKASELINVQRYTEALPLLEKIAAADPEDAETQFYLGFALIARANVSKDAAERESLRARARVSFLKAKGLGYNKPILDAVIQSLDPDAPKGSRNFSPNAEADRLMHEAESSFAQGGLDEALASYQKALALDPDIYEAALYSGDVYTHRGDFAQAEVWYQKAIRIDPTRETAYRYSATPLMKQQKYAEARERYVEAFITEPYSQYAAAGLTQWARATNTRLAHPAIDIPVGVSFDPKGNANVQLDPAALGKDDGSYAWLSYGATRTLWRKERFAKAFPREAAYRHTLAEEADALRAVVRMAAGDKQTKALSPSLAKLKRLDEEGLLEAYVLLARPDEGIAQDHPADLKQNRERLRRYVVEYVLTGGGNLK